MVAWGIVMVRRVKYRLKGFGSSNTTRADPDGRREKLCRAVDGEIVPRSRRYEHLNYTAKNGDLFRLLKTYNRSRSLPWGCILHHHVVLSP